MPASDHRETDLGVALFEKIKANDAPTLKRLYRDNYMQAERYVLNNSGSADDAKDVFQESFIALWRNVQLGRFEVQHEQSLQSYLFRIVRNKWMDKLRDRKKQRDLYVGMPENKPDLDEQYMDEYLTKLKRHYNQMGEPCKELLYRFYFKKFSLRDIGLHFSWTEATAKNNKYRCLQKLRTAFNKENKDSEQN